MFEHLTPQSLLILGAVSTYVIGFLFRDQILTRLLVGTGSILYIIYYLTVGDKPLWDAAIGSTLITLSSLQGVVFLWWSRSLRAVPKAHRDTFKSIGHVEPGLLRRLVRASDRIETATPRVLVREGEPAQNLWYCLSGGIVVERQGHEPVTIMRRGFVGEVAWLTGCPASATVHTQAGSVLLRWNKDHLRKQIRRSQRLEVALDALIAKDLATKVAQSHPIAQNAKLVLDDTLPI